MTFILRIIKWNEQRYDQKYVKALNVKLLDEELDEYANAEFEHVEELDALVDIIYVAVGCMWKRGLTADQINKAILAVCDSNDSKVAVKTEAHIKANIDKGSKYFSPTLSLTKILMEVDHDK